MSSNFPELVLQSLVQQSVSLTPFLIAAYLPALGLYLLLGWH